MKNQPSSLENLTSSYPLTDAIRAGLHRATPADAAAVRDLTRAAYAKWVPVIGREPRPMTADYDVAVHDHMVDLLHLDSELAALIEMRPEVDHLLIVNVAVSPAYQGHGYGRALLVHAEELARSLGLEEVRLYTNGSFTDNVKLYRRVGYRVDREEVHPQLGAAVYMSKRVLPVLASASRRANCSAARAARSASTLSGTGSRAGVTHGLNRNCSLLGTTKCSQRRYSRGFQPACSGRHVRCGWRQSIPSNI